MTDLAAPGELAVQPHFSFFQALRHGAIAWSVKGLVNSMLTFRQLSQWWNKGPNVPDMVKTYPCRPSLPIRIFFPKGYERNSNTKLPTLFMVHGGGFLVGDPSDDDLVNRRFADTHGFLVIELNYRKGPGSPFPVGLRDLEAILIALYSDLNAREDIPATERLPIDQGRVAISGFSAGACIALGACQLPSIQEKVRFSAVIPVYPVVDQSIKPGERALRRHYKTTFPGLRGNPTDLLARLSPYFVWSYLPYGQDLRDPLLSPAYAAREELPRGVFVVGAELDQLCHEGWRLACRLGGKRVPPDSAEEKPGQEMPAAEAGKLIMGNGDERFYWENDEEVQGVKKSVRWLLIPDAVHGFNLIPPSMHADPGAVEDAKSKAIAYEKVVAEWLVNVIWKK
ncbi:Alpha/Beta hydrolase protein [Microdochium trichocladiopsis]|uniref:Alpha/Beta hydrolase protein n=1 Tax=Microdochium trichocladiopsis TaxID=1682393 RepID=A0A9P9BWT2_9PEZI|nr:Alpha/Beta hydrolase protein [Microdochium trichocladiopsis]KAH7040905.1 Alpha/Beta hydrolase protein [Microdochium trichocladiopsis]